MAFSRRNEVETNLRATADTRGFREFQSAQARAFAQMRAQQEAFSKGGLNNQRAFERAMKNSMHRTGTGATASLANGMNSGARRVHQAGNNLVSTVQKHAVRLGGIFQQVGFQATLAGTVMTRAFTAPAVAVAGLGTAMGVKLAAKLESAKVSLGALLPVGYNVEALLNRLRQTAIKSPVFNTPQLVDFTRKLVATGTEVNKTERIIGSLGKVFQTFGVSGEGANLALRGITQAFSKGKLQAEELTGQIGEQIPALALLSRAAGVSQGEFLKMVSAGEITSDVLGDLLIKIGTFPEINRGATASLNTMQGAWDRLKESVFDALAMTWLKYSPQIQKSLKDIENQIPNLVDAFGPMVPAIVNGFLRIVKAAIAAVTWYNNLSVAGQKIVNTFALIAVAIGPAIVIFGKLFTILGFVFSIVNALTTPVGVLAGVIFGFAVILGIAATKSSTLRDALFGMFEDVKNGIKAFGEALKGNGITSDGFVGGMERIGVAIRNLKDLFTKGGNNIAAGVGAMVVAFRTGETTSGGFVGGMERIGVILRTLAGIAGSAVVSIIEGISGMFHAMSGEGITSDGFVGAMERVGVILRNLGSIAGGVVTTAFGILAAIFTTVVVPALKFLGQIIATVVLPALVGITGFIARNQTWFIALATGIGAAWAAFKGYVIVMKVVAMLKTFFALLKGFFLIKYGIALLTGLRVALMALFVSNPVGLIIAAIVGLGAALVVAYKKSEAFRNVVQNVFNAIAAAGKWMWENVLRPIFTAFANIGKAIGNAMIWLWENGIKPVWDMIKAGASALWAGISWVFSNIDNAARLLGAGFSWLWNNAIKPAWEFIKQGAAALWAAVKPIFDAFAMIIRGFGELWNSLYTKHIGPAFNAIKTGLQAAWGFLAPIFATIGNAIGVILPIAFRVFMAVAKVVWAAIVIAVKVAWAIISVIFQVIWAIISNTLIPIFKVLWAVVKFAFAAIAFAIKAAWVIIAIIFALLWKFIKSVLVPIFIFFWTIVSTVFKGIWTVIKFAWNNVIKPVFDAVWGFIKKHLAPAFVWLWKNVIAPAMKKIGDVISVVWNKAIWPVFRTLRDVITKTIPNAFRSGTGAIGSAWSALGDLVKKPVNWVISYVLNRGIIESINKVAGFLNLPKSWRIPWIPTIGGSAPKPQKSGLTAGRAMGGRLTGGIPGRDSIPILAMEDEYIIRRDSAKRLGFGLLEFMNHTGRIPENRFAMGGQVKSTANEMVSAQKMPIGGSKMPAMGGPFDFVEDLMAVAGDAVGWLAKRAGLDKIGSKVGLGTWGKVVGGAGKRVFDMAVEKINQWIEKFFSFGEGGDVYLGKDPTGSVNAILQVAKRFYPGARVSSGYRNTNDYHGRGLAADLIGGGAAGMKRIAQGFYGMSGRLIELIHSASPGFFVKNGRRVGAGYYRSVIGQHYNHVHVAARRDALALPASQGGGGSVGRWVRQAMALTGVPASWFGPLVALAMHESSGNPTAQNNWDSNARRGTPSRGLFQTIGPTFAKYSLPGMKNIWNAVHNAVAAIRYIRSRYGSIFNIPSYRGGNRFVGGYELGTPFVPQTGMALVHKGERIIPAWQNRGHQIQPYRRNGGEGGVHVHFDGPVMGQRDLEDAVTGIIDRLRYKGRLPGNRR